MKSGPINRCVWICLMLLESLLLLVLVNGLSLIGMKPSRHALLALLLFASFLTQAQSAVCAYKYRKRITFDPAKVTSAADLTDFTALISFTSDNDLRTLANSGHVENASGYDIVFAASDGVTLLSFQLEKYTASTGELVAWVRIPTLSTTYSTSIYMYYGNSAITTDQSSNSAWSSSYEGVWHLNNNILTDASGNGNNGVNGGSTNTATAKFAGGRSFGGAGTNYLQLPLAGMSGGNGNGSVSFWGRVNSIAASKYFFGESTNQDGSYANRLQLYINDASGNLALGLGGNHSLQTSLQALAANTWYHIALTWSNTGTAAGSYSVYVNGVQKATGAYASWSAIHSFADIGNDGNAGQRTEELNGAMDEVHVTSTTLNTNWFLTEYNNQSSPSTFYSVSTEPKIWNGTTNSIFNAAANWTGGTPATNDDVLINNGTNQPILQGNVQFNSLFIRTGATLSIDIYSLAIRSDITSCGVISGGTGTLSLNSTTLQQQYISGSGTYNLTNLTINNTFSASPQVSLSAPVNVTNTLTLTSGILYTSTTNLLSLGTSAVSGSGSASSFVSGPMSKTGTTDFVFPVGKGTSWRRLGISNLGAGGTYRAEYFNAAYSSTTPVTAPLWRVSKVEYWQLDLTSGTPNAKVSLYWENAGTSGINSCADLSIARWSGASWDERPAIFVTGSSCSGSGTGTITTNAVVTAFSPFTFASKVANLNPLPIQLVGQNISCENGQPHLRFTTAVEQHCGRFEIMGSPDALSWSKISVLDCAEKNDAGKNYDVWLDDVPYTNHYYRLTEVDIDGKRSDFPILYADCSETGWQLYPNPADGVLNVRRDDSSVPGQVQLQICGADGRVVYENKLMFDASEFRRQLDLLLPAGIYTVIFKSGQDEVLRSTLLTILH